MHHGVRLETLIAAASILLSVADAALAQPSVQESQQKLQPRKEKLTQSEVEFARRQLDTLKALKKKPLLVYSVVPGKGLVRIQDGMATWDKNTNVYVNPTLGWCNNCSLKIGASTSHVFVNVGSSTVTVVGIALEMGEYVGYEDRQWKKITIQPSTKGGG
jgi:hypothetical protein